MSRAVADNALLLQCDEPQKRTVYVNLLDTGNANHYPTEAEARAVNYLNVKPLAVAVPVQIDA